MHICTYVHINVRYRFGYINPKLLIMVTWDWSGPGVKERGHEVKRDV